jgi:hypothetical protein
MSVHVDDGGVERVYSVGNDGFDLLVGYPDKWHVIIGRKAARQLAWFVFRWWAHEWFGLRRWLYFRRLHKIVAETQKWGPQ